jgi:hypothetical protein
LKEKNMVAKNGQESKDEALKDELPRVSNVFFARENHKTDRRLYNGVKE